MTPIQKVLLVGFVVLWLLPVAAVIWSVVAVYKQWMTTSHFVQYYGLPLGFSLVALYSFSVGLVIGHLYWPLSN